MLRGTCRAAYHLGVADEKADPFDKGLDQLERVLAAREAELQRLRAELALKTLYAQELQATLDAQSRELESFDARLRQLEGRVAQPQQTATSQTVKPVPMLIRIRNRMRE